MASSTDRIRREPTTPTDAFARVLTVYAGRPDDRVTDRDGIPPEVRNAPPGVIVPVGNPQTGLSALWVNGRHIPLGPGDAR